MMSSRSQQYQRRNTSAAAQHQPRADHLLSVYDADFTFCASLDHAAIVHMPPQELRITRHVLCRNYVPHHPESCSMGHLCKFIHADVDLNEVERRSVHVNYAWRSPSHVHYPCLPRGDVLHVLLPSSRGTAADRSLPADAFPSERLLVTRGALQRKAGSSDLTHCSHYYYTRQCDRGEQCNFIHAVHVDPTVQEGEFRRAPPGPRPSVVRRTQRQQSEQQEVGATLEAACADPRGSICGLVADVGNHQNAANPQHHRVLSQMEGSDRSDSHFLSCSAIGGSMTIDSPAPPSRDEQSGTPVPLLLPEVLGAEMPTGCHVGPNPIVMTPNNSPLASISVKSTCRRNSRPQMRMLAAEVVDPWAGAIGAFADATSAVLTRPSYRQLVFA